jgi:hypothetical protein
MSASTASPPQKLLPDEQPLAEYRSLAPLAVVSVILGVASALILTSPLLAPLPVAAIVAAIAALRTISRSGGQLAGSGVAIVGLCLGTFFLGLGLTSHLARQRVLEQRAHEMTAAFLGLLQEGKAREAHQFRQPASNRLSAPEAIKEYYEKNSEAAKELQGFATSPVVKDLTLLGHDANVRFEAVSSATRDGKTDMLVLRYSFQPAGGSAPRKPIYVHVNRRYDEASKRYQWDISGVSDMPPPGLREEL